MRTAIVAVVLLVVASAASAQVPASTVRKIEPKRAGDLLAVSDCNLPALPSTIAVPWNAEPGDKFVWCVDGATTAQATSSDFGAYVDNGTRIPLEKGCISVPSGTAVPCLAPLPTSVTDTLRKFGRHTVEVTRTVNGVESARSSTLLLDTPGCKVVDLSVSPPVTLDAVAPIAGNPPPVVEDPSPSETTDLELILRTGTIGRRTQHNTRDAASAIGQLRRAGWRVEWWRTQFEAPNPPTSSAGGHWYFLAWCVGTPTQ